MISINRNTFKNLKHTSQTSKITKANKAKKMLDSLIGGGFGHRDQRGHGHSFGFEEYKEHKEFVSHEESGGGFFDQRGRFDNHMRRPGNHGQPPMAHMSVCEEEEEYSDMEEYYESSHKQQMMMGHHNKNNQFNHNRPPPPPKRHMDKFAYPFNGNQHHNRLMAPQLPPRNMFMSPNHGNGHSGGGAAGFEKVKASEKIWKETSGSESHHNGGGHHYGGGHQKVEWGNKAL